jgi:hypothetical protein
VTQALKARRIFKEWEGRQIEIQYIPEKLTRNPQLRKKYELMGDETRPENRSALIFTWNDIREALCQTIVFWQIKGSKSRILPVNSKESLNDLPLNMVSATYSAIINDILGD